MKKALSIFKIVVAAIAAMIFAAWILLQTPRVQTAIAGKLFSVLEKNLNGSIEVSRIHLRPFNAIIVKDLVVLDGEPPLKDGVRLDTLLKAESVVTTFSIKGLFSKEGIHFGRATVKNGAFYLTSEEEGSNLSRFLNIEKKTEKNTGKVFDIDKVHIENFRFRLINLKEEAEKKEFGIDWKDLDVMVSDLKARNLELAGGYMSGILKSLYAGEKSGYLIKDLSGKAKVGHGRTLVEEVRLTDAWSVLDIPEFTMTYDNSKSFKNFVDEVRMGLILMESELNLRSLSYFAPVFKDKDLSLRIQGADAEGSVNDLTVKQLSFSEKYSGVSGKIYCKLSGTTDAGRLGTDCRIMNLTFTTEGAGKLMGRLSPESTLDIGRFAEGETLVLNGSGKGTLDKLDIVGELTSGIGTLNADMDILNLVDPEKAVEINGSFSTNSLELGKLAAVSQLGECTMRGAVNTRLEKGGTSISIDTLFVDRLSALGYNYSNIAAAGTYSENAFNGRVICNDPNLSFLFQGIFTFSDKTQNRLYKFYANIGYADLQALKLDRRGGTSKVSGQVNANYMSIRNGDIIGNLDLNKLVLENDLGRHEIGNVAVESHSNNDISRMNLNSKFATASFVGSRPVTTLANSLKELTLQREVPSMFKRKASGWKDDEYEVRIDFHDARDILSFVLPGLYIADKTAIRLNIEKDGSVDATIKSPRLAMGKNYLKDFGLAFNNKDEGLSGTIVSSEISAAALSFQNSSIALSAKDDHVGLGFTYDNKSELADRGEIHLSGELARDSGGDLLVYGRTLPSSIYYNNDGWKISSSAINILDKSISVDNLTATCNEQSIRLNGGFSSSKRDTLSLEMVKFNMDLLNKFLKQDFNIAGRATGRALVTSPWKSDAGVMMNLTCDSTMIAGRRTGTLRFASSIDDHDKMHIIVRNDIDGERTVSLSGNINTASKKLDIGAEFNGMDIGYLTPLLSSVFSEMDGRLSGKVKIGGKLDSPVLSSEGTRFDNALLRVGFTKVPYNVNGPFTLSGSGLTFNDISITDRYDGKGTVSGGILFGESMKSLRMDTRISMNRMECLDTDENDNPSFYGRVFANGDVRISGPFNAILLDINATTSKEGNLHIPLDNTSKDRSSDLLYFKEILEEVEEDPYELMMNKLDISRKESNDFGVKLRINASPQVQAFVEIDRAAGNVLSGRGQGLIDINVRPNRDVFTINGDYTINDGSFHFNAMNIAQRDFTITGGSSIRFNGDVMDSDLDIDGVYSTKASIATLIADTTSTSNRRMVNCGIGVSGKLREPDLSFSIDIPDLDPTTKSKVESALNTDDKVQRQFLTLLISGNFMPDEQSGVVNNTNSLYSNVAEIMAGQLNNILQKLDIPLDLGLNYQSKESGIDIFDVAVSTKLFNDRVLVNGAFGNRDYTTSGSERDVVGDLDIEIKLDKPGQLRLNLFSHSADNYTSYLDNTQRSGVGITYQKEFNTFREFFRDMFSSRKQKEARQREEATSTEAPAEKETNVIVINEYE